MLLFFFNQMTAYEMRISDWSSACALPIYARAADPAAPAGDRRGAGNLLHWRARTRAVGRFHPLRRKRAVRRYARQMGAGSRLGHVAAAAAAHRSRQGAGNDDKLPLL